MNDGGDGGDDGSDDGSDDKASIIFQPAPESSAADAALRWHDQALAARSPVIGMEGDVILGVRHPFEDLRAGDRAKIIGPNGEDYMENIDAPSLAEYCDTTAPSSRCTLTTADATRILTDMATALYYIHHQGFAHNDVKPSNILFSQTRGAVLIDFGISTEPTETGVHAGGTPWYIPPEYAAFGSRGPPGDVFALGVVMLYVLGKLRLPELYAPELHWKIADVRIIGSEAFKAMKKWQDILRKAAKQLNGASILEMLVKGMVDETLEGRISSGRLVEESSVLV